MEENIKLEEEQVWRKDGPYDWLKIVQIIDPNYPNYDGGIAGCRAIYYPPQLKGLQLRGGKIFFVSSVVGMSWEEQIKHNRHLLEDGLKHGDNINNL